MDGSMNGSMNGSMGMGWEARDPEDYSNSCPLVPSCPCTWLARACMLSFYLQQYIYIYTHLFITDGWMDGLSERPSEKRKRKGKGQETGSNQSSKSDWTPVPEDWREAGPESRILNTYSVPTKAASQLACK